MPPSSSPSEQLFGRLLHHGPVRDASNDHAWLQAMLDVEAALARALCAVGRVSSEDATAIGAACRAELYDAGEIGEAAMASGNPVPELVQALAKRVDGAAAGAVHAGATSQDILDTALMLVARRAISPLLVDLEAGAETAARLARQHRDTPMAGRTLLQQALPTTFGLKAAGWMTALDEAIDRLNHVCSNHLPVQLGGPVGTLAAYGEDGARVVAQLASELQLSEPVMPWHTRRTPLADLAGALGGTAGAVAKIATDVVLLAQSEAGEVGEAGPEGRGGSSAMPHKRNPVAAIAARACAAQAPGLVATIFSAMNQEHERAAGAWHAEWQPVTALLRNTGSAAAWLTDSLSRMNVNRERMRSNLDLTGGLILSERVATALSHYMDRLQAHDLVAAACRRTADDHLSFLDALASQPRITQHLDKSKLAELLDPATATGMATALVDRALAHHRDRPRS